ncbi:Mitochondrial import receptor subunit tom22 [Smittium mucronatum]|uniref:Mitochondrial import receptor subunit tom22 n=1 Tax=Smittium mucronatum TaxID=133383 RepID=A0A1R0H282_9FUNG|nr:Mitochondrial import receptor subunit tom22 [Smittium mucronatum]
MVEIKELDADYVSEDGFVTDNDNDSDLESDMDSEPDLDETMMERLAALVDIVPASTRARISSNAMAAVGMGAAAFGLAGKVAWFLSTAALLIVFPLALESDKEQVMVQYEKEQQMLQQQTVPPGPGSPIGSQ